MVTTGTTLPLDLPGATFTTMGVCLFCHDVWDHPDSRLAFPTTGDPRRPPGALFVAVTFTRWNVDLTLPLFHPAARADSTVPCPFPRCCHLPRRWVMECQVIPLPGIHLWIDSGDTCSAAPTRWNIPGDLRYGVTARTCTYRSPSTLPSHSIHCCLRSICALRVVALFPPPTPNTS